MITLKDETELGCAGGVSPVAPTFCHDVCLAVISEYLLPALCRITLGSYMVIMAFIEYTGCIVTFQCPTGSAVKLLEPRLALVTATK